jgi:carboxymethylenebutenolidase
MPIRSWYDGDRMAHEHLYWDQAAVLVLQLGLLESAGLPVVGAEGGDRCAIGASPSMS